MLAENVNDNVYHPMAPTINPREIAPISGITVGNLTPYETSYWKDLKTLVGWRDKSLTPYQQIMRTEDIGADVFAKTGFGVLSAARLALMFGAYSAGGFIGGSAIDWGIGKAWKMSGIGTLSDEWESRQFAKNIGMLINRQSRVSARGGFSSGQVHELSDFLKDVSKRSDMDIKDVQKELVSYVNEGLITNTTTIAEFKRQYGQLKTNIKKTIEILGGTQEDAVKFLGELNRSGVGGSYANVGLRSIGELSRRTGVSAISLAQVGVTSAQSFQGTGISGGVGFNYGIRNYATITAAEQAGLLTQNQIWQAGGAENAAALMTNAQLGFFNTPAGNLILRASMSPSGNLDIGKALHFMRSGPANAIVPAAENMVTNNGYLRFIGNESKLREEMAAMGPDALNIMMMSSMAQSASMAGVNIWKKGGGLDVDVLRGFATNPNLPGSVSRDQFDLIYQSIRSSYNMRMDPAVAEAERRMNEDNVRAFIRKGRPLNRFFRRVGESVSNVTNTGLGDVAYDKFEEVSNDVNNWYKEKVYGTRDLQISDAALELAKYANIEEAKQEVKRLQDGYYGDISFKDDQGELITTAVSLGRYSSDVASYANLEELYTMYEDISKEAERKHNIKLPTLRVDKDDPILAKIFANGKVRLSFPEITANIRRVPGYERFALAVNENLITGPRFGIIKDFEQFEKQTENRNKFATVAQSAIEYMKDPAYTIPTKIGGHSVDTIRRNVHEGLMNNYSGKLKEFKKLPDAKRLEMMATWAGVMKRGMYSDISEKELAGFTAICNNVVAEAGLNSSINLEEVNNNLSSGVTRPKDIKELEKKMGESIDKLFPPEKPHLTVGDVAEFLVPGGGSLIIEENHTPNHETLSPRIGKMLKTNDKVSLLMARYAEISNKLATSKNRTERDAAIAKKESIKKSLADEVGKTYSGMVGKRVRLDMYNILADLESEAGSGKGELYELVTKTLPRFSQMRRELAAGTAKTPDKEVVTGEYTAGGGDYQTALNKQQFIINQELIAMLKKFNNLNK